jgi:alpha-tubulin suppressor-like RCC1 family protein
LEKYEESKFSPTWIELLSNIKSISAGSDFGMALDHSGTAWSFGNNHFGQLGLGDFKERYYPHNILEVENIIQISCGNSHR